MRLARQRAIPHGARCRGVAQRGGGTRGVAALRQLREKDRAPTLLFTRGVAVPTGLR